ncbi:MAG: oxidoreductase [Chloroflexi bacterium]|jgi:NAD(P)-dependent dehydrogenase (short-subunit alcohol dehydrogenase family)|nr:oxidoreductase [Chloroflexota bacterium]MDP7587167.1 SDR family oxidoreductase [Dehalococcoidia bacterium]MQF89265.1 SDR family oxidoreductase [SAR202 cluster bacterium]|tara:strand:+ start:152 stop:1072 length:921 start_codon:yes stop_codon:yes gene_type:complete
MMAEAIQKGSAGISELQGRVVAVTGAARGMGRAMVTGFLAEGAKVVAMDVSWDPTGFSGDSDDAFLKELQGRQDNVLVSTVDISDGPAVEASYQATMDKFGTVDALVNNAGLRQRNLFPPTGKITTLETKDSDWEKMFGVGVFGTLKVTRKFIQPMLERQSGSVISVISGGAMHTAVGGAYVAQRSSSREMPYQSAKAATLTMMFYLADEVQESNVAVNILIPGNARTTGYDEQNEARRTEGQTGSSNRPGRFSMTPEHIVPITLFLASQDANTGITGKCFDVPTWNMEHGLGGPEAWRDPDANRA